MTPSSFSEGLIEGIICIFRGKTRMQTNVVHLIDGSQCQGCFDETNRRVLDWGVEEHTVCPAERNRVSDSSEA